MSASQPRETGSKSKTNCFLSLSPSWLSSILNLNSCCFLVFPALRVCRQVQGEVRQQHHGGPEVLPILQRVRGKLNGPDSIIRAVNHRSGGGVQPSDLSHGSGPGFPAQDELLWAAAWLYHATHNRCYMDYLANNGGSLGGTGWAVTEFGWDVKYAGVQVLAAKVFSLLLMFSDMYMYHSIIALTVCLAVSPTREGSSTCTSAGEVPTEGRVLPLLLPWQGSTQRSEDHRRPIVPAAVEQHAIRHQRRLPTHHLLRLYRICRKKRSLCRWNRIAC